MEAVTQLVQVAISEFTGSAYIEALPPGAKRPLIYRIVHSLRGDRWTIRDPFGAMLCRASNRECGIEIATRAAERVLAHAADDDRVA